MNAYVSLPVRLLALIFGAFFIIQGITTAGFLAIVGLFSSTAGQALHMLAYILGSLGLVAFGIWLLYAGVRNFPHVTAYIRDRRAGEQAASR
jgi:hypothetical protein